MEKDFTRSLNYIAKIPETRKDQLGSIRHWDHLKIARKDKYIWVKGFTSEEITSTTVRSIPYLELYYSTDSKLYPLGKKIPVAKMEQLIWAPILKGLPIESITFNHNLFEVTGKIEWKLRGSSLPKTTEAILIDLSALESAISGTPNVRLNCLKWTLVDEHKALIIGTPPLSIRSGEQYWKSDHNHFLPLGYEFRFTALEHLVTNNLNPSDNHLVFWSKEGTYSLFPKDSFVALNRSSVRRSAKKANRHA